MIREVIRVRLGFQGKDAARMELAELKNGERAAESARVRACISCCLSTLISRLFEWILLRTLHGCRLQFLC